MGAHWHGANDAVGQTTVVAVRQQPRGGIDLGAWSWSLLFVIGREGDGSGHGAGGRWEWCSAESCKKRRSCFLHICCKGRDFSGATGVTVNGCACSGRCSGGICFSGKLSLDSFLCVTAYEVIDVQVKYP
eukprot:2369892-Rhodomonas_salina.2